MAGQLPDLIAPSTSLVSAEGDLTPQQFALKVSDSSEAASRIVDLIDSLEHFPLTHYQFGDGVLLPGLGLEAADTQKQSLLKAIVQWIKQLIAAFTDELTAIDATLSYISHRAVMLEEASRNHSGVGRGASFVVDTRVANLCVRYKPITQANELLVNLQRLEKAVAVYYGYDPIRQVSNVVQSAGNKDRLIAVMQANSPERAFNGKGFMFEHPVNSEWQASFPMMDNVRVVLKGRPTNDPVEQLKAQSVRLMPENMTGGKIPNSIEFLRFNHSNMISLTTKIGSIAKKLSEYSSYSARRQRVTALDQLASQIERLQYLPDSQPVSETVDLLKQYVDWCVNPYTTFLGVASRNLTASLNVCAKNLNG